MTGAIDVPRGPDVKHRVRVPARWLDEGAEIELELPRNLTCAACDGGGCDRCGRAGAVSLRGRKEPAELIRVTLPSRLSDQETTASGRAVVVRIPERGGLSDEGLRRGLLLLQVMPADEADPAVHRVEPERAPTPMPEAPPPAPAPVAGSRVVLWVTVVVVLWVLLLIWLRLTGRG